MVENICAPATPYGNSAIAIIRCSGPEAISLVARLFKGKNLNHVKSHTIHYGYLFDGEEIVDEVVVNVFLAPHSYDGENTIEINCHGGILVTSKVLKLLLKNGFRMAEPGEFSKRAFLNKRLDLTQAEAIMDIIGAQNDLALKAGQNSLRKSTTKLISTFREELLDAIAKIEVNIDYPEYEDSVQVTQTYLKPILLKMLREMDVILNNSKISTLAIKGIKTAIVGKPNVGKSSLLNFLLAEEKAIVSDIPGTTRDMVEGSLNIGNITLHLIDTAGIHESIDQIEKIGIERSNKAIERADLVLLVLDSSRLLDEEDEKLLKLTENKRRIIIANKTDKRKWSKEGVIYMSALNQTGLDELALEIAKVTQIDSINIDDGNFLANQRQVNLMEQAYIALKQAYNACDIGMEIDLIEIDMRQAFDLLGTITGESSQDELITALFTKFCLGK